MEARRSTLGVAVMNGLVYAIGGFDGSTGLSSGEVYDPKTGMWRSIANMSTRRSSVGVGVIGNLLYAVSLWLEYLDSDVSAQERVHPRPSVRIFN